MTLYFTFVKRFLVPDNKNLIQAVFSTTTPTNNQTKLMQANSQFFSVEAFPIRYREKQGGGL